MPKTSRPGSPRFASMCLHSSRALAILVLALAACASAGVFEEPPADYKLPGSITTSDSKSVSGLVYTTLGKPVKIYDPTPKKFVAFTLAEVSRIDVQIAEQHEEPYWYWKESGSDEKIYTGKTYPWRKYLTTVTFVSGKKITGQFSGLIHIDSDGKKTSYTLYKRQKGKEGQKPDDLVFVKSIVLNHKTTEEPDAPPDRKPGETPEDQPAEEK